MSIRTRLKWVIGVGALALALVCVPAQAAPVQAVKLEDPITNTGNGGPFKVTFGTYNGGFTAIGSSFWTFCLESQEYITPTQYARYTIDEYAIDGKPADTSGPAATQTDLTYPKRDPLDDETAWLYYQFRTDEADLRTIAGVADTDGGTAQFYIGIQEAIWALEGNGTTGNAVGKKLRDYVLNVGKLNVTDTEKQYAQARVAVLNLFSLTNPLADPLQSQLVLVPLPASVWAGLILLGGYGIVRFRRAARA